MNGIMSLSRPTGIVCSYLDRTDRQKALLVSRLFYEAISPYQDVVIPIDARAINYSNKQGKYLSSLFEGYFSLEPINDAISLTRTASQEDREKVEELELSNVNLANLAKIAEICPNLRYLRLSLFKIDREFIDFLSVNNFIIKDLNLYRVSPEDLEYVLVRLTSIQSLYLFDISQFSPELLTRFGSSLKTLVLSDCKIDDQASFKESLSQLSNLEYLNFNMEVFIDVLIDINPSLKKLCIGSRVIVEPDSLKRVLSRLTNLEYLMIKPSVEELTGLPLSLKSLLLSKIQNEENLKRALSTLPKLEYLDLSDTDISGDALTEISPSVRTLILAGCARLESAALEHTLIRLPNLEELDLSDTLCRRGFSEARNNPRISGREFMCMGPKLKKLTLKGNLSFHSEHLLRYIFKTVDPTTKKSSLEKVDVSYTVPTEAPGLRGESHPILDIVVKIDGKYYPFLQTLKSLIPDVECERFFQYY